MLALPDKYSWADAEPAGPSAGWPDFTSFSHTVPGSSRVIAFLCHLHYAPGGRIFLRDFLVALSCVCRSLEARSVVAALVGPIEAGGWGRTSRMEAAFRSGELELSVSCLSLQPGVEAVHVFLGHGDTESSLDFYLGRLFPPHGKRIAVTADRRPCTEARPPTPTVPTPCRMDTRGLAEWLRREACIVRTGAGISLASGIPPFEGPGSLDAYFQVDERFPGAIFDWAVQRPAELALLLGSFQAALVTARPNAAHLALAELERRGVVKQILTTSSDRLHQAAGSVRVRRLENARDWVADLSGRALLVTGVSHDDFGVVKAARGAGMDVAILAPAAPEFAQETDLYLPGRAEDILPRVTEMLAREKVRF